MSRKLTALAAVLMTLTFAAPAHASSAALDAVFSSAEASTIRAWYREHGNASDRGRGNKRQKSLPPGIARNLQRGKPLPPGIAKQVLPSGLIALLPPPPKGHERIVVAGKVLLVEVATQVIRDVLEDVILD